MYIYAKDGNKECVCVLVSMCTQEKQETQTVNSRREEGKEVMPLQLKLFKVEVCMYAFMIRTYF